MPGPDMTISVVIAVYNGAAFIGPCLESVLKQSQPPSEIIVVNDGSTDDTARILAAYGSRIVVLTQANAGRSTARNRGMDAACGDYVAFLDADDRFLPHHIETLAHLARRTGAEIVHCGIELPYLTARENGRVSRRRGRNRPFDHFYRFQIAIQAAMIDRNWFRDRVIEFPPELEIAEDALFFWKAILLGARLAFVEKTGTVIGIHEHNTTRDYPLTYARGLAAYDALLAFIRERAITPSRPALSRIAAGRRHIEILGRLLELQERRSFAVRLALRRLMLARDVSWIDRVRCLLGQAWPAFPLARRPAVMQALFGYTVMRMERRETA